MDAGWMMMCLVNGNTCNLIQSFSFIHFPQFFSLTSSHSIQVFFIRMCNFC